MTKRDTPPSDALKNSLWYAAAASAAIAVPSQVADAQIVYTDIEPDVTIENSSLDIDFEGDGVPEMNLSEREDPNFPQITIRTDPEAKKGQFVDGIIGNGFPFGTGTYAYTLPLDAGREISSSDDDFILLGDFSLPAQATFTFGGSDPNSWIGAGEKFIGVRFTGNDDNQHYGWVRVSVDASGVVTAYDFAYETQADTPIVAGAGATATDPDALEGGYLFSEVSPNPVTGRSTFELSVGQAETVTAELFDSLGRRVQTLFAGALTPGNTETVSLTSAELPAGVYVVRVTGESFVTTRNVTIVR